MNVTSTRTAQSHMFLFVLCMALIGFTLHTHQATWLAKLLPTFQSEMQWMDDTHDVRDIQLTNEGSDKVIRLFATQQHCFVLASVAHCPNLRILYNASTMQGHVTLALTLLFSAIVAWPSASRNRMATLGEYVIRLLVLPLAVLINLTLDIPFTLWAAIWRLHIEAYAPDSFSPLLAWAAFLQGGGRVVVPLLCATGVIWAGRAIHSAVSRPIATLHPG